MKRLLLFSMLISTGCGWAVGPSEPDTPIGNYDTLWRTFDELYPMFDERGIDWDAIGAEQRARLSDESTDAELFEALSASIEVFGPSHEFLSDGTTRFPDYLPEPVPGEFDLATLETLVDLQWTPDEKIAYGTFFDAPSVAYVFIPSWEDSGGTFGAYGSWVEQIDAILQELDEADGLVLDVRTNTGGSNFNGQTVIKRFLDEEREVARTRYRTGSRHDDKSEWTMWSVGPPVVNPWHRPVVVVVDERIASATEWFVIAMRTLPHVTIVGQPTHGILGSRVVRTLPNGWTFGVTIEELVSADGEVAESRGIVPDIEVTPGGRGTDAVLQAAVDSITGTDAR